MDIWSYFPKAAVYKQQENARQIPGHETLLGRESGDGSHSFYVYIYFRKEYPPRAYTPLALLPGYSWGSVGGWGEGVFFWKKYGKFSAFQSRPGVAAIVSQYNFMVTSNFVNPKNSPSENQAEWS